MNQKRSNEASFQTFLHKVAVKKMLLCKKFKTLKLRKGRKVTFLTNLKQKRYNNYKNTLF